MKILFTPSNKAHVKTFLMIARELDRRGHSARFLHRDSLISTPYHIASLIDTSRYSVYEYDRFYESDLRRGLPSLSGYRRFKKEFGQFLDTLEFDTVVVSNDDSTMFERLVIDLAYHRQAASMLIQESVRPCDRSLSPLVILREVGLAGLVRESIKQYSRQLKGGPFFRKGYGYGNCTRIVAAGDVFRRQLIAGGVAADRIVVTGQPRLDIQSPASLDLRPVPDSAAGATLLFCNQPLHCRQSTQDKFFVELAQACFALKSVRLVFKLHPRDLPPDYWLSLLPPEYRTERITVEQEKSLSDCFPSADAMMTIASTTALEAMAAGLPIGLVNYLPTKWHLPYDQFDAAVAVNSSAVLSESIEKLLFDRLTRETCVANAESVLHNELYLRDGRSAERIVDTLEEISACQSESPA